MTVEHHSLEPCDPRCVAVLGAGGFVGSDLMASLTADEVSGIPSLSTDVDLLSSQSVALITKRFEDADALVFVAALTPDKGKDITTFMNNLVMCQHLCRSLDSLENLRHVVYISSDAVYAEDANPLSESSPCNPGSFHGMMHLARELMLSESLKELSVPLLVLRPSLLYGASDTHNGYGPNRFARNLFSGEPVKLFGKGEEKRDHVYIRDLTELVREGLRHRSSGVLNVATGTSYSFLEVVEMIASEAGQELVVENLPRSGGITHCHFDVTEMRRAFPKFRSTFLSAGIAATLEDLQLTE